jgi:glycosyltransferase involved in cell wall biosynthesis
MASLGVQKSKLLVLENGVNMNRFLPGSPTVEGRYAFGAALTDFLVICVAHHAPIKGLHVLLEAFEQFACQYPDVRLAIIGKEATPTQQQYSNSLYAKVIESPVLRTRVTFCAPSDQIHRILPQADLVVQPSLSESFGRAVLEASSCGIPIVASDVGGLKETVVDGRTGWLVPSGSAAALANALTEAYLAPAIRNERGRLGIEHAKKYKANEIRKRFFAVCSSIQVLGN